MHSLLNNIGCEKLTQTTILSRKDQRREKLESKFDPKSLICLN